MVVPSEPAGESYSPPDRRPPPQGPRYTDLREGVEEDPQASDTTSIAPLAAQAEGESTDSRSRTLYKEDQLPDPGLGTDCVVSEL